MKTKITALIAISWMLFSCTSPSEKPLEQPKTDVQKEQSIAKKEESLELNNGEKWAVNAEMMPYLQEMERDINDFSASEQKDYPELAGKLKKNVSNLTSSCTMDGRSHEELHKWLVPYIGLVKKLSTSTDQTEAAKIFEEIQTSFITFKNYFQ